MNNIFAERLKKAMEQKNMKQIDLVKKAAEQGVKLGKRHVSQYLSGKTTPRSEILNFLATTLGVETEWLKGTDVSVDTLKKETNEAGFQMENMKFDYNYNNMKENDREAVEEAQVREFKKSSKLNNVLYDVRGPVVEEAARMENAGTQVLKLNIGNPAPFGFRTPDEVIYDMRQQLTECEGYSPAKGLFSARKAIMQYAQLKKLPNVSIEDIYTGNGVSELINLSMSALLDNGDEILIPSPDYPLWTACATLAGGKAVHYICDEQAEWYPDMDDIRKKITSRTKAIVIINPNNPTGALYPREVLQDGHRTQALLGCKFSFSFCNINVIQIVKHNKRQHSRRELIIKDKKELLEMGAKHGNLSINSENIFPIISNFFNFVIASQPFEINSRTKMS